MTSVSELKNVLKPMKHGVGAEEIIDFFVQLKASQIYTPLKNLKVPYERDYRDPNGYRYYTEKKHLVDCDELRREEYVLASLDHWAPNGTLWWTYAFSDVSEKFFLFSTSDESMRMLGKKHKRFHNHDDMEALNDLLLVRRILTSEYYAPTKKQKQRLEELYNSCSIIDLGLTEKADYECLDHVCGKLVKMFNIPKSDDYEFMSANIYKYAEWTVSIYNKIFSHHSYVPRVSNPIHDFVLDYIPRHKFSEEVIKSLVSNSNAAQVFMYFSKAL